jgi:uncharacterized membrane protein YjgN (DUF898 family)
MFNLRNTAFRNIRFNFKARYGQAAKAILLWGWLIGMTAGLAYPIYLNRKQHLLVDNSYFGTSQFNFDTKAGAFYARLSQLVAYFIGIFIVLGIFEALFPQGTFADIGNVEELKLMTSALLPFIIISLVIFAIFAKAFIATAIGQLVLDKARLGNHRFSCSYKTGQLFWLYLSNALVIALSLGMALPWAQVRKVRYLCENIALTVDGTLDDVLAAESEQVGALGEEMGESWDLDIGIGA